MKVTPISRWGFWLAFWAGATLFAWAGNAPCRGYAAETGTRSEISLDGDWEIAESLAESPPGEFTARVPVPGLADMANPAFVEVGTEKSEEHRRFFWYRRTFRLEANPPPVVRLRIRKAMFTTAVFVNGQQAGEHAGCFTPAVMDITRFLRGDGAENELLIRVGAHRNNVPKGLPDGWDFEKVRYIPGIYDSVELLPSGNPYIENVQIVPDIKAKRVRAVIELVNAGPAAQSPLAIAVTDARSGQTLAATDLPPLVLEQGEKRSVEAVLAVPDCRLWSPEDPYLCGLRISTAGDIYRTRFGMREFRFDPQLKMALLNGKPYPLRGTNVTILRFFEDAARGGLPWQKDWVRSLHRLFRRMHWNSARYCIGFPPDFWYDIADEEGILIQDEFPIWYLGQWPSELKADALVEQYTEWMRHRWNHPSVVIWDAQNESSTEETGEAIRRVRGLDLSRRPWDNGWGPPQDLLDVFECHPYPFYSKDRPSEFRIRRFGELPGKPNVPGGLSGNPIRNEGDNPIIINEYGWLWLMRDGNPCTLSRKNYESFLGDRNTAEERRRLYARILAAKTEFWRSRRKCAGVLHFCGLGYSRPDGQTSDHFIDLERLILDPYFQRFVGDAFAPVLAVVDFWEETAAPADRLRIVVINDREHSVAAEVRLEWRRNGSVIHEERRNLSVPAWGTETMDCAVPDCGSPGTYEISAVVFAEGEPPARSYRLFTVSDVGQ